MFDRLFVIHCKRLHERRVHMEAALQRHGWEAHWITAFDPAEIPPQVWRDRVTAKLKQAEVSLYLKHLAALREIVGSGVASALVLEDDAILPDEIQTVLEHYLAALPADCEMAFFAPSIGRTAAVSADRPLYADGNGTRSTCAYLVVRSCAERLLEWLDNRPIRRPIDLAIDEMIREHQLVTYWSVPPIIEQGSETGLFAHSLGVGWRDPRLSVRWAHRVAALVRNWGRPWRRPA